LPSCASTSSSSSGRTRPGPSRGSGQRAPLPGAILPRLEGLSFSRIPVKTVATCASAFPRLMATFRRLCSAIRPDQGIAGADRAFSGTRLRRRAGSKEENDGRSPDGWIVGSTNAGSLPLRLASPFKLRTLPGREHEVAPGRRRCSAVGSSLTVFVVPIISSVVSMSSNTAGQEIRRVAPVRRHRSPPTHARGRIVPRSSAGVDCLRRLSGNWVPDWFLARHGGRDTRGAAGEGFTHCEWPSRKLRGGAART